MLSMADIENNIDMTSEEDIREINVEVILEKSSTIKREYFENHVITFLQQISTSCAPVKFNKEYFTSHPFLEKNVVSIYVSTK